MIDGVPYEGPNQFDRGVTLKLVLGLYEGIFENFEKWSSRQKKSVNNVLIKTRLPSEVNRLVRSAIAIFGRQPNFGPSFFILVLRS